MAKVSRTQNGSLPEALLFDQEHYKELKRRQIIRLLFTYLLPLVILIIYFYIQYNGIVAESRRLHLGAIAENQSNTLNLFLSERIVNLNNIIHDPRLQLPPRSETLRAYLRELKQTSETFVDIGYFDSSGVQTAYEGPYPSLEKRNYGSESWYQKLKSDDENFIITDIYLGFRQRPHFTIAVRRIIDGQFIVMRATLDPEKIYEYMRSLEGAGEVFISIVNKDGTYQLVTPHIGTPLESASIVPPQTPRLGAENVRIDGARITYAYSWLKTADWALIVQRSSDEDQGFLAGFHLKIISISLLLTIVILFIIFNRAGKLAELQKQTDETRLQLEHASKLASVGELAAGIAHEINNPLAIINEEAGLIKDLMNPEFGEPIGQDQLYEHLDTIQESVFRCRDITHKLLRFVRKSDIELKTHDFHQIIDGVVDGLLIHEMEVSNIEISKEYSPNIPQILTDGNQLQQVILNIINNGVDAIGDHPGKITIKTSYNKDKVRTAISDTGSGIEPDKLDKIFLPFFTTKEVGKGTGLGLSVSYGIIKNLGGTIEVNSVVGQGSTFTIILPVNLGKV